jgi:hypothetical protein
MRTTPYLANLKRGKVLSDSDFDDADIAAANACRPFVEADSHGYKINHEREHR